MDMQFEDKVVRKWLSKRDDAQRRGIEFNLSVVSIRNLLLSKKCYYLGTPLSPDKITIDRVDGRKGYVKGNVVACSNKANQVKEIFEREPQLLDTIRDKMNKHMKGNTNV